MFLILILVDSLERTDPESNWFVVSLVAEFIWSHRRSKTFIANSDCVVILVTCLIPSIESYIEFFSWDLLWAIFLPLTLTSRLLFRVFWENKRPISPIQWYGSFLRMVMNRVILWRWRPLNCPLCPRTSFLVLCWRLGLHGILLLNHVLPFNTQDPLLLLVTRPISLLLLAWSMRLFSADKLLAPVLQPWAKWTQPL